MSQGYPAPPVRPRVIPGKGVPMRQWSAPSYSQDTGRQHSSIETQNAPGAGNHCRPSALMPGGYDWAAQDRRRTQGRTGIKQRPYG
jgi:hypothetical protein